MDTLTDSQTSLVFTALADPTRRQLFQQLCEEGSGTVTHLAAQLPITRQAVTKHLTMLSEAGMVTVHKQGRERLYVPQPASLQTVMDWIAQAEAHWDKHLAALRSYLIEESQQEQAKLDE
jgi:DNA-binding transcriptional ArsR family regulator